MRVAFLNPSGQLGGAERSLLDILASLRAAHPTWELHLLISGEGPMRRRAEALSVKVEVLAFPDIMAQLGDAGIRGPSGDRISKLGLTARMATAGPAILAYVFRLARYLRRVKPDVIHTNGFKMHVLGLWARPGQVPLVWHVHDYVSVRPVMSRLIRLHSKLCSAIVANSDSVARDVERTVGPYPPVYRVYNAVDPDTFSPEGEVMDLDFICGLSAPEAGTVRVGLVATLGRWKGHATFLRALSLLPRELRVRGYIIGGALYQTDGSQYTIDDLRAITRELGIGDQVGFTGFVEEPAAAMRALDVVVHGSTQPEPFGLVVVEAMSCGKALVASQAGGSAELFTHELNALGYPPGNAEAMSECIERLVRDADLRRGLGAAGRQAVETSFHRSHLAGELVPIYRAAVMRGT